MNREKEKIHIRVATIEDAKEILEIYAPYVTETAITFEYDVPSLEEFQDRMKHTLKKYPYIVAKSKEGIVGYAYSGVFKGRKAYDWAVETTIYVKKGERGRGIGRMLYGALESISKAQNILNLNACIAYPEVEDKYLMRDSVKFHERLGYRMVGEFHQCGYKFGTWYHMVWMEKMIGEHEENPLLVIDFPDLSVESLDRILSRKII